MFLDQVRNVHVPELTIAEDGFDEEDICLNLIHRVNSLAATPRGLQQGAKERKDFGRFKIGAKMRK